MTGIRFFITSQVCLLIGFLTTTLLHPSPLQAAYCSLRDPVSAIRTLYPEANSHRSVVQSITEKTRRKIAQRLPFTLHFNEIGRHTLYVISQNNMSIGFVHARSELSDWGLIEIAWAITPDLTINNLFFQRCRSPQCNEKLKQQVLNDLKGKKINDILLMLDNTGQALAPDISHRYFGVENLALALLRSSLKTITATEYGWQDTIQQIQRKHFVSYLFPQAMRDHMTVLKHDRNNLNQNLQEPVLKDSVIDLSTLNIFIVKDNNKEIARLVEGNWKTQFKTGPSQWLFTNNREVLAINFKEALSEKDMELAFSQLIGKKLPPKEQCANASEMTTDALYTYVYSDKTNMQ